jgi:hypothetical protein
VGVTNYYSSLFTNGFTAAEVTIGELAKGKGLLVMRSWMVRAMVDQLEGAMDGASDGSARRSDG